MQLKVSAALTMVTILLSSIVKAQDCQCGLQCVQEEGHKIGCQDLPCVCKNNDRLTGPVEACVNAKCPSQLGCTRQLPCQYCHVKC